MKEIEALQESGLSSSDEDPFDKVIKKGASEAVTTIRKGCLYDKLETK